VDGHISPVVKLPSSLKENWQGALMQQALGLKITLFEEIKAAQKIKGGSVSSLVE
jgi:hypothetical protein